MSTSHPRLHVLIPAAGVGLRAGGAGPKQYQLLDGQPLVAHTLAAFAAVRVPLASIALVVALDDTHVAQALPGFPALASADAPEQCLLRVGGATRAATVQAGLQALQARGAQPQDWVLVHDAARCLVTPAQIEALIAACEDDAVGGLLALPLPDTLKASDGEGRVAATLSREGKWLAQTPQMFRLGVLDQALAQCERRGVGVTDEASAIEAQGFKPRLVPGSAQNFKITYPDDFALAQAVLQARSRASS
ncbi:2-C-methyl-D-erythritol 4-phosphate cytidylyltransferase [Xenophilus arseniciresistens]|uniref:2-C-methyl-D-erythritol 4-phosphate cytidylyltransferase n=1 Tax=Xenophilus arseniciresistens TaxID=1283306 RepID=A0AAE3SZR6_9BURK|nr:2-C-methyl-D-erythritol 4-phosphate cytidylyltransferase [Xenophilus arseniciresistens]MDA7417467.1 2-C-methyl-D-erythritol 4-phosphate cytidylyltransferase [Xenophilus arseniciresistens]